MKGLSELEADELKQKVLKYLETVSRAKNRDVARAIEVEKHLVDKVMGELAKEGKVEYQGFGGITYVVLKGK